MTPLIGLLTDFGHRDTYVGQLKAALWARCPQARLCDLTHEVPPQDVIAGAWLLQTAVEAFPAGSLFVAVVDPGVGTERRKLAVESARGDLLIGPDNGLLLPAAERLGGVRRVHALENRALFRAEVSHTFHGRDVFAPVAASLASGVPLEDVGPAVSDPVRAVRFPSPVAVEGGWEGEVLHVDGYGNLVTNLPAAQVPSRCTVTIAGREISEAPMPHYQAVPPGALLAVIGSSGTLEISQRDGSAARALGVGRGAPVRLR